MTNKFVNKIVKGKYVFQTLFWKGILHFIIEFYYFYEFISPQFFQIQISSSQKFIIQIQRYQSPAQVIKMFEDSNQLQRETDHSKKNIKPQNNLNINPIVPCNISIESSSLKNPFVPNTNSTQYQENETLENQTSQNMPLFLYNSASRASLQTEQKENSSQSHINSTLQELNGLQDEENQFMQVQSLENENTNETKTRNIKNSLIKSLILQILQHDPTSRLHARIYNTNLLVIQHLMKILKNTLVLVNKSYQFKAILLKMLDSFAQQFPQYQRRVNIMKWQFNNDPNQRIYQMKFTQLKKKMKTIYLFIVKKIKENDRDFLDKVPSDQVKVFEMYMKQKMPRRNFKFTSKSEIKEFLIACKSLISIRYAVRYKRSNGGTEHVK